MGWIRNLFHIIWPFPATQKIRAEEPECLLVAFIYVLPTQIYINTWWHLLIRIICTLPCPHLLKTCKYGRYVLWSNQSLASLIMLGWWIYYSTLIHIKHEPTSPWTLSYQKAIIQILILDRYHLCNDHLQYALI